MLKSRLDLLSAYLKAQPASYLTDASIPVHEDSDKPIDHQILRSIQALTARQALLAPSDSAEFENEAQQQNTDVTLVGLLTSMTRSVNDVKQLGKKWHFVEPKRRSSMHASAAAAAAAVAALEEKDEGGWTRELSRIIPGAPLV
jgi:COP9 signalosome complex subunit 6